jgi:hypothetical protein
MADDRSATIQKGVRVAVHEPGGTTDRTARHERHLAIIWLVVGVALLVAMLGMWWLVEETNEEGTHDAELLPFFALIPLSIGAYHLARSRRHGR